MMLNSNVVSEDKSVNRNGTEAASRDRKTRKRIVGAVLAILATVAVSGYYIKQRMYESTDNASLEGSIIRVSPRVAGQVVRVHVRDNQHVNRGDLLLEIDPSVYEAKQEQAKSELDDVIARSSGAQSGLALTSNVSEAVLIQARAALDAARAEVGILRKRLVQEQAGVRVARANLQQAEARRTAAVAEANRADADASRYRRLFQKDEVSRQHLDRAESEARTTAASAQAALDAVDGAKAQVAQAEAGQDAMSASLVQAESLVRQSEGRLREAQSAPQQVRVRESEVSSVLAQRNRERAALRQAELDLAYTRVYATESGYVTRKSVEPGNFVEVGDVLMGLVVDRYWVVANFKETQLTHMRAGQAAEVKVDAYPQLTLHGRVESIQSGTGARFSLIPPENATGNYVKVVQRVPVKIVLLDAPPSDYRLGPGMSVEPKVRVR